MESLTNILDRLEPQLVPRRSLVQPVLSQITTAKRRARMIRRALWFLVIVALITLIIALTRSSSVRVVQLGWQQWATVRQHLPIFIQALGETVPWMAVAAFASVIALAVGQTWLTRRARVVRPATLAGALVIGSLSVSAGAYAAVTSSPEPGPAFMQLERIINSIGKQETVIEGQTFEFPAGLTDTQIRAQAEMTNLNKITNTLPVQRGADGGQNSCACRVVSYTNTSIKFEWYLGSGDPISPNELVIDAATVQYIGLMPVPRLELRPGDFILVAPSTNGITAAYIAKPTYTLPDVQAATQVSVGHALRRPDGLCFNNIDDFCPVLPAIYDFGSYLPPENDIPAGAIIREVYGSIIKLDDREVQVRTSSGQLWTFVISNWISVLNESGIYSGSGQAVDKNLKIGISDHLRVEFWQKTDALDVRTVYGVDPDVPATRAEAQTLSAKGDILTFRSQIRSLQLALSAPWELGQIPHKY